MTGVQTCALPIWLFSPSLATTDKPYVNTATKDRLHAKTGRRRKKSIEEVSVFGSCVPRSILTLQQKPTTVPEIILNDPCNIGVAQNDKQPLAVSTSANGSAVVNLPSHQKSRNVSVETDDVNNCNESSFSADSQSSENSVGIFSVSPNCDKGRGEKFMNNLGCFYGSGNFPVVVFTVQFWI